MIRKISFLMLLIVALAACNNQPTNTNDSTSENCYSQGDQLQKLEELVQNINADSTGIRAWIVNDVIPKPSTQTDGIGMEIVEGNVTNFMNDVSLPYFRTIIYEEETENGMEHTLIIIYSNEKGDAAMFQSPTTTGAFTGEIAEPLHVAAFKAGNFTFQHLSL